MKKLWIILLCVGALALGFGIAWLLRDYEFDPDKAANAVGISAAAAAFALTVGVAILLVWLALLWIVLPYLVWSYLKKIEANTRQLAHFFNEHPVEMNGRRYEEQAEPAPRR